LKIRRKSDPMEIAKRMAGVMDTSGQGAGDVWSVRCRGLAQAISLAENDPLSVLPVLTHPLVTSHLPQVSPWVVGITGLPGAGKSTLISLAVGVLRSRGLKVAVLAVDPSSPQTGGAILGDRIRMQDHFKDPEVFIRSMGSRGAMGGISHATRSALHLLRTLDFDVILLETVGVGQNESEVLNLADSTVLVLMPNSGDEIQLMKAGVFQSCDVYVVNKADLHDPSRLVQELEENAHLNALSIGSPWTPEVCATHQNDPQSVGKMLDLVFKHQKLVRSHPEFERVKVNKAAKDVARLVMDVLEPEVVKHLLNREQEGLRELVRGTEVTATLAKKLVHQISTPWPPTEVFQSSDFS